MAGFKKLKMTKFLPMLKDRQVRLAAGKNAVPDAPDNARVLAKALHPKRQYLTVRQVIDRAPDTKSYILVPDESRGTKELAYFSAGKYLSVFVTVNGMPVSRAYSVSSSPKNALEGFYELTVRKVDDGLVSRHIHETWQVGTQVEASAPAGNFEYQPLRDAPTVIGLAGGSGITPFLSMARAIRDGDEDFTLILLYGSKTADGILFKDELDEIAAATEKVKVVHVLSDGEAPGMRHGFLTAELIREFAPADAPYSVFLCGSQAMYAFADKEVEKLGLPKKYVRHELFGEFHNPASLPEYPAGVPETVTVTVTVQDETFTVTGSTQDSVMQILEKNGIAVPARCRSGECGFCHTHMLSGEVFVPRHLEFRRMADVPFGCIHPCCSFPLTDLVLNVPPAK